MEAANNQDLHKSSLSEAVSLTCREWWILYEEDALEEHILEVIMFKYALPRVLAQKENKIKG